MIPNRQQVQVVITTTALCLVGAAIVSYLSPIPILVGGLYGLVSGIVLAISDSIRLSIKIRKRTVFYWPTRSKLARYIILVVTGFFSGTTALGLLGIVFGLSHTTSLITLFGILVGLLGAILLIFTVWVPFLRPSFDLRKVHEVHVLETFGGKSKVKVDLVDGRSIEFVALDNPKTLSAMSVKC